MKSGPGTAVFIREENSWCKWGIFNCLEDCGGLLDKRERQTHKVVCEIEAPKTHSNQIRRLSATNQIGGIFTSCAADMLLTYSDIEVPSTSNGIVIPLPWCITTQTSIDR